MESFEQVASDIAVEMAAAIAAEEERQILDDLRFRFHVGQQVMARTNMLGWRLCEVVKANARSVWVRLPLGKVIERKLCDVKERG